MTSSAFMMGAALIISLLTNFSGIFPPGKTIVFGDFTVTDITSNLTILLLAIMMTISLSRIPSRNLSPTKEPLAIVRGIVMGVFLASIIPIIGYLMLKDTEYVNYAKGLVFIAATPFAASVAPLSFILRGDMEHAVRTTIYAYVLSLVWIPIIVFLLLRETVNMTDLIITVIECIGIPLIISRFLVKVKIDKVKMAIVLNSIIAFLVWMAVSATNFGNELWILAVFMLIAGLRTFGLGIAVEVTEKRLKIPWSQRVTDILMMSYKNKGIAIALCVATMGPLVPYAMVAVATSIIIETTWVVVMDSVIFSRKRMKRELAKEGLEISDP
ncbi:MAG: Na+-dependent transporter [Methanomassiliicoccaceae archaeon]|nr:Na+-dependent transporter [Methanomassiliicoccaceae archaeon]